MRTFQRTKYCSLKIFFHINFCDCNEKLTFRDFIINFFFVTRDVKYCCNKNLFSYEERRINKFRSKILGAFQLNLILLPNY